MMVLNRWTRGLLVIACGLLLTTLAAEAQRQRTRLLVVNRTGTEIQLEQQVKDTWQSRNRIRPGATYPVYNVTNGDRFRAQWRGGGTDSHEVKLEYDRSYGGYQDEWTVAAK